jgi:hypothetical protein
MFLDTRENRSWLSNWKTTGKTRIHNGFYGSVCEVCVGYHAQRSLTLSEELQFFEKGLKLEEVVPQSSPSYHLVLTLQQSYPS